MHSPRAGSDPRACFIRPSEQVKNTRNFFCMTEILLMNLNFIQLSTNLQLITIRNGSSDKNIKPPWAPPGFFLGGANPETSLCSKIEGHICLECLLVEHQHLLSYFAL